MHQYVIYSLILVITAVLSPAVLAVSDEELEYPDIGILSSNYADHSAIRSKMFSDGEWLTTYNSYGYRCKRYKKK